MEYLVVYLVAAALGLLISYWIIRGAVLSALKAHAVWVARGGAQAVLDQEEYARTGIRPKRD